MASTSWISCGRCSGSSAPIRLRSLSSARVARCGAVWLIPWTTRCPTAWTSPNQGWDSSHLSKPPTAEPKLVPSTATRSRLERPRIDHAELGIRPGPIRSIFPLRARSGGELASKARTEYSRSRR